MDRRKLSIALLLIGLLLVIFGLLKAETIKSSICRNFFYLELIRDEGDFDSAVYETCIPILPEDEETSWWKGYAAWMAGKTEDAINYWGTTSEFSVANIVALSRGDEYSTSQKAELLRLGLLSNLENEALLGKLCFAAITELPQEEAYRIIHGIWISDVQSPSINGSLAYLLTRDDPASYEALELFQNAFLTAPRDPYLLVYGFRIYLDGGGISDQVIDEMLLVGEEIASTDIVLQQNLSAVYQKRGDFENALRWNLSAMRIIPKDLRVNLRQLELAYLSGIPFQESWIEVILTGIETNPDQGVSFYQRLISVLEAGNERDTARTVYCQGVSSGLKPELLLLNGLLYLESEFQPCN